MRTLTIPYELAERLADVHMLEPYPPAAYEQLRELLETLSIDLDALDWASVLEAAAGSTWMPPEYCRNDWVADVCRFLRDGPPRQKLEIGGSPSDGYDAWFTDSDGNLNTVVCFSNPMATADWCDRNGFAWEVIGLEGDPVQWLVDWRAQQ